MCKYRDNLKTELFGILTTCRISPMTKSITIVKDIGVSEAKSQEGRKFFYRLTMGYLINILPADFNSITG